MFSGSGDNRITGSSKPNYIYAGTGGADTISAGAGNDIIHVNDGAGDDVVDCGDPFLGTDDDTVNYDQGDQIAANCEQKLLAT